MKWLKRIFLLVVILSLIGAGGFVLYSTAYAQGETAGYNNGHSKGYSIGQEVGYVSGKTDGYGEGYVSGMADGYDEGYVSGKADGYDEGYVSGKTDGYDEGMEAGLGHGYTLRDPTYEEVISFLSKDKTDKHKYSEDIEDFYVCSHFARDVCNNAEAQEFRCAYIELRFPERGHSIIAFDTIDEGLVYFEPQTDKMAKPMVGKRYYQCVEPEPGYHYEKPPYDDTIIDILIIW